MCSSRVLYEVKRDVKTYVIKNNSADVVRRFFIKIVLILLVIKNSSQQNLTLNFKIQRKRTYSFEGRAIYLI